MQIIVAQEIEQRSEPELKALYLMVTRELTKSERGSPGRRNGLASLGNVVCEMNARACVQAGF